MTLTKQIKQACPVNREYSQKKTQIKKKNNEFYFKTFKNRLPVYDG